VVALEALGGVGQQLFMELLNVVEEPRMVREFPLLRDVEG
jgi:hypothetical protein